MDDEFLDVDPLEEVYAVRQKISARYGHDLNRLFADAESWRKRDEAAGFTYIRLPIARVRAPFAYPVPDSSGVPCACEAPPETSP